MSNEWNSVSEDWRRTEMVGVVNRASENADRACLLPSKLARAMDLDSDETCSTTSDVSGMTNGRKDSERGATGVMMAHGTDGATIGPPAVME